MSPWSLVTDHSPLLLDETRQQAVLPRRSVGMDQPFAAGAVQQLLGFGVGGCGSLGISAAADLLHRGAEGAALGPIARGAGLGLPHGLLGGLGSRHCVPRGRGLAKDLAACRSRKRLSIAGAIPCRKRPG